MFDLLIRGDACDIAVEGGVIVEVGVGLAGGAAQEVDARGLNGAEARDRPSELPFEGTLV